MERLRNATYDLREAAELTGRSPEELRRAVDRGDLATTEGGREEPLRFSGTELERWYLSFEGVDESPFVDPPEQQ